MTDSKLEDLECASIKLLREEYADWSCSRDPEAAHKYIAALEQKVKELHQSFERLHQSFESESIRLQKERDHYKQLLGEIRREIVPASEDKIDNILDLVREVLLDRFATRRMYDSALAEIVDLKNASR